MKPDRERAETTERLVMDLAHADSLAMMLARSRASQVIEVADLLAGMYIYEWERLSKYCKDEIAIETFLQKICRISPQRWHYWIQFYDSQQRDRKKERNWRPLRKSKQMPPHEGPLERSAALRSVLQAARDIAPFHDTMDGRAIPILTSECVLLCIARSKHSRVARALLEAGLDVDALERDALHPKYAPLR